MNGLALKQAFLNALAAAGEDMVRLDLRRIYDQLDAAALLYVRETNGLTHTHTITSVAGQQAYDLPPDFLRLGTRDRRGRYIAKYVFDAGASTCWPAQVSIDAIFRKDWQDARQAPACFAIRDKAMAEAPLQGQASEAGALLNGAAVLTDHAAAFTAGVYPRDTVVNVTRNSSGLVTATTDGTHVACALFPEGINSWRSGDAYLIQPQARQQIYLDAPSAESGHSFILPYMAKPAPVYTPFASWRLDAAACWAIAHEAAFLFAHANPKLKPVPAHHQLFLDAVRAARYRIASRRLAGA